MTVSSMVDPHLPDEAPTWTVKRIVLWSLAPFVAVFVIGIVAGFFGAHLEHQPGGAANAERLRSAMPLVAAAVVVLTLVAALRRSWPKPTAAAAPEWQARAAARQRQTVRAWLGTGLGAALGAVALFGAAWAGLRSAGGIALLAIGIAGFAGSAVAGTVWYMKVIDEQERAANLWCGYVGLTVYVTLFFAQYVARALDPALPRMDDAIFGITALVAIVVFLRVRFR